MSPRLQTLSHLSLLPSPLRHDAAATARPLAPSRAARARPVRSLSASADATREHVPVDSPRVHRKELPRDGDGGGVSGIQVPRQRYIPVSKAELLDAILSEFDSEEDARQFARFARCLDSVLHAEHNILLEEMRIYHSLTCLDGTEEIEEPISSWMKLDLNRPRLKMWINGRKRDENGMPLDSPNGPDVRHMLDESVGSAREISFSMSRAAAAARFQQAFMKLLRDAQFEEISAQDLILMHALNTDYLLTLPIYVDWKKAFQSNAIIFRRGYAAERQKGLLLIEKLDYLQSKVLQGTFSLFSKPVKKIGSRINEALKQSNRTKELQDWIGKAKTLLTEKYFPQDMLPYVENGYTNQLEYDGDVDSSLPIWLAAQRAMPLYEGLLSSIGPRGRLMRKMLAWIGFIPSLPEIAVKIDNKNDHTEAYLKPSFLHRVTISDIWKPARKESCESNPWKMLKTRLSILLSQSCLQEPAFQELILLYTEDASRRKSKDKDVVLPLQLKIYEKIPIPDLPVIFPHKKLSFRILDTIRLDVASILGLLAFFLNYKFETVISSPSAFFLDLISIGALIIYATRVALGYKQTWDRYQLLVNKTLYEKTLASGFGSVHFLLDASQQQQYKEAILAYAVVLISEVNQAFVLKGVKDACERFVYNKFKKKVEMPIDKAMETLLKLKIVKENSSGEHSIFEAFSSPKACDSLKNRWDGLLTEKE